MTVGDRNIPQVKEIALTYTSVLEKKGVLVYRKQECISSLTVHEHVVPSTASSAELRHSESFACLK